MCIRTVFWDDTDKDLPQRPAQSQAEASVRERGDKPQNPQIAPNGRILPSFLADSLDFLRGISGIKSS